ncbi:MAG: AsmA family protein [Prevotellaceae bacterium]|nr:AsmA family protein [Prevotellaceae bacterium]
MKALKITLKVLGILIVVLILAVITVPTLFRGKIESIAKETINEKLNAQVDFNNLSITLLSTFPNVTLSIENIVVAGIDNFEGDTLAQIKSASIVVDVWALIKGNFVVKSVSIDNPDIKARLLADGSANWNIMKPDETIAETPEEEEPASEFKLSLKKLTIKNANILYDNQQDQMFALVKNLNLNLSGELSSQHDLITLSTQSESVSVYSGKSPLLSNIALAVNGTFDADFSNNTFTLQENEIQINKMALKADGVIKNLDDGIDFDLTYGLKIPSLKSLLGLIPSTIVSEVNDIETQGDLQLNATMKGVYNDKSMPIITLALKVKDGYIKYSGFSEAIKNLNIDLDMTLNKNKDMSSVITLSRFSFEAINSPFMLSGKILYPFTDPDINFTASGKIDFSSLRRCLPLVNTSLDGALSADISFAGLMSQIENKQYEKVTLSGNLALNNFKMKLDGVTPDINIDKAALTFKPTLCTLNSFDAKMGKSDLHLSGYFENMLPYVFKGSPLKGNLNLKSDLFDCNELMSSSTTTENQSASVSDTGVIILPSNIDFAINANVNKLIYDNITMTNFVGNMNMKEGKLNLEKISSNTTGGRINISGSYAAQNTDKAAVNMKLSLDDVTVDEAAKTFDIFGKFAPILKEANGKASFYLDFSSELDKNMSFDYKTLNAQGNFKTNDLKLAASENLSKLAGLLKIDSLKTVKNVNLNFAIKNGMIKVNPFDVKLGNFDMKIGGEHGLANDLNYDADIDIPAGKIGSEVNNALSKLGISNDGGSGKVKVGLKIKGTMTNPSFGLGLPTYGTGSSSVAGGAVESLKETAQETVKTIVDSVKTQAKEKIETVIDSAKNKAKEKVSSTLLDLLNKKK